MARGAKRSKRRFGGLLSPMFLVEIEYFEKSTTELVRIEGCTLIHYYASIYGNLQKILVGCCLLEITERVLIDRDEAQPFFALVKASLDALERRNGAEPFPWVFLVKALVLLGFQPQFGRCIHCRRTLMSTGRFGFSIRQGGSICGACIGRGTADKLVEAETLHLLERWKSSDLSCLRRDEEGSAEALREVEGLLSAFMVYHVTRDLRSLRVLKEVCGTRGGGPARRAGH